MLGSTESEMTLSAMKSLSQNSNLYDHYTSTSQTDRRTDRQLAYLYGIECTRYKRKQTDLHVAEVSCTRVVRSCDIRYSYSCYIDPREKTSKC